MFSNKKNMITKFPVHIGIIMDGNGRWATQKGFERHIGHKNGLETIIKILKETTNYTAIKYITLYSLSVSNLKRPRDELESLFNLMNNFIDANNNANNSSNNELLINSDIKISTIGDCQILPIPLKEKLNNIKNKTKDNTGLNVIFAINYDSTTEITNTFNKMLKERINNINTTDNVSWDDIHQNLYTGGIPDPDLIIRTSGEYRLSNFLMLQSANAELIFINKLWPDFDETDFNYCLTEYSKRQRRFGLTPEQQQVAISKKETNI